MNDGLIAQRYALALYKYAADTKHEQVVYDEMKKAVEAFAANPALDKTLANPFVSKQDKENLLLAAAGDPQQEYRRFVKLILDKNRENYAHMMALAYRDLYRKANNISQVNIVTAQELPDSEMEKIRQLVVKAFPQSRLEITQSIDPDIIGGFVIYVDNLCMNASLSNEIEQLRQNLISSK